MDHAIGSTFVAWCASVPMDASPSASQLADEGGISEVGHALAMPIHERPVDRGLRRGRFLVGRTASELLVARRGAGLSQRELGRLLRVSHTKIGRVERGEPNQLTIELAAKMAAVLGLQLSVGLHPDGDAVRDAGHLALIQRFRARVPSAIRWRTEVAIPIAGDRRSADIVLARGNESVIVEAETRLDDIQAVERRLAAKLRDVGMTRAILLVADTRHNRAVIRDNPAIGERFPLSTRACLTSLARGELPDGDGLVVI